MKITGEFYKKIHMKISRLSALDFEDTDKLDYINKAKRE